MTEYEKLKDIIDEIGVLIFHRVTKFVPEFQAWYTNAERFLSKKYGTNSIELSNFRKTRFSSGVFISDFDAVEKCKAGLLATKLTFETYLREIQVETNNIPVIQSGICYSKIFIVHGHDGALKESVARIIEKQEIEAIILSEKANQGRTIIEKFENYSDVGGAVCLFTADDVGKEKSESEKKPRARQNVVFEAGYFIGKLGRDHVAILSDSEVEMPSDLAGVVYTKTENWQIDLLKELKAMGYPVDFNKLF